MIAPKINESAEQVFRFNRIYLTVGLIGSALLLVTAIWLACLADYNYASSDETYGHFLAFRFLIVAMILLFGWWVYLFGKALQVWRRAVVLNADGIVPNGFGRKLGPIEWRDIVAIVPIDSARNPCAQIQLKDPRKYLRRMNSILRFFLWLDRKITRKRVSPIGLPVAMLTVDLDTFVAALRHFHARFGE